MDEASLFNNWYLGLGIAVVIIIAAAALLLMVWFAARRILRLAKAALQLVIAIKENTNSIWSLETTNEVAVDILDGAQAIEGHAALVAEALHETERT